MTECQSPAPEPSPESVRRSLRSLAEGSAPRRSSTAPASAGSDPGPLEEVVEDAERAVSCAVAAAAFLLDVGLNALDDAVTAAERCGHDQVAQRGRRSRAILRDLDAALSGRDLDAASAGHDSEGAVIGTAKR
ncbi:hypothetical protein [Halobellus rarus]|uniref:Uncharacterized protein n=1 Tax=Halobellus rarus TaxID=1126237 RepID=A0ABD6CH41_9EURY|nr:hypothetical protein [Halobellus rarus]